MTRVFHNRWMLPALTSAVILVSSTAAQAESKTDRARQAIAVAETKIHAAEGAGASTATPNQVARADEVLADARAELRSGYKDQAILDANHAGALADASTGETHRLEAASANNAVEAARSEAAGAREQANEATEHAQAEAADARQQAAEANARAANAEQSAAISAQQAEAAQTAEAATAAGAATTSPPAVTTTVSTADSATAAPVHTHVKHVVRESHGRTHAQTTTTVVQTQ